MSDLTVPVIDKLLNLAAPTINKDQEGYLLSDRPLNKVSLAPDEPETLHCSTLAAIVTFHTENLYGEATEGMKAFIHVKSPTCASLESLATDKYGRRRVYAQATFNTSSYGFPFAKFLSTEEFIIQAQMWIQRVKIERDDGTFAKDLDYIINVASNVTAESALKSEDDGISQRIAYRAGVALAQEVVVKGRVNLAPYRTFPEIDQVVSEFLFRMRKHGETPEVALFEADGQRWKSHAVEAIKDYFGDHIPAVTVIA